MNYKKVVKFEYWALASAALFIASSTSLAKTINTYGVDVEVENNGAGQIANQLTGGRLGASGAQVVNQLVEIGMAAKGVTCTSSLSVSETESMLGKKGQMETHTFSSASDFALTAFGQPQSVSEVTVNPDHADARINVSVQESCNGTVTHRGTCTDSQGNSYSCLKSEDVNLPMHWQCEMPASQLSTSLSDPKRVIACNPPNDQAIFGAFSDNPLHSIALNYLHSKTITISTQFQGSKEHSVNYNCPNNINMAHLNPDLDKVLHFDGGIKTGAFATNDIDYKLSINGGPQIEKDRADGLTNFDVLYCKQNANQPIDISLGAQYGNKTVSAQEARFDGGVSQQTMHFQTKGSDWAATTHK